eukprot:1683111-Rhodomonas_salina.1
MPCRWFHNARCDSSAERSRAVVRVRPSSSSFASLRPLQSAPRLAAQRTLTRTEAHTHASSLTQSQGQRQEHKYTLEREEAPYRDQGTHLIEANRRLPRSVALQPLRHQP